MPLATTLQAAGLPVAVVNPRRARAFGRASGQLAKTDRMDAQLLARMAARMRPPVRPLPEADRRDLRALVVRRRQLAAMCAQEKTRLHSTPTIARLHPDPSGLPADRIGPLGPSPPGPLQSHPTWCRQAELLRSVPGVGPVTAAVLWPTCRNWDSSAARLGFSGRCRTPQPGQWPAPGKAPYLGGRAGVRRILYMATLSAIRHIPPSAPSMSVCATRANPGKWPSWPPCVSWLIVLNAVMRDQVPWQREPVTKPIHT